MVSHVLFSAWFAWCLVLVSGKLIQVVSADVGLYVICARSVTVCLPLHHQLVQIDASYKVWRERLCRLGGS